MFSPQILSLDQRIQKAISFLPPAYRFPPEVNSKEAFGSLYAPIPDIFLILVLNLFKWPKVLMHLSSQLPTVILQSVILSSKLARTLRFAERAPKRDEQAKDSTTKAYGSAIILDYCTVSHA